MEPDGEAGGCGPPSREFDSPHSPWVFGPEDVDARGMVTHGSHATRDPLAATTPVMLGWLSARFVRGTTRVRDSPNGSDLDGDPIWRTIWLSVWPTDREKTKRCPSRSMRT